MGDARCRSRSDRFRLDEHAALHLHVHGVTEPGTVVPEHAGLIGGERYRRRRHRRDFHVDAVIHYAEPVRQILHRIDVPFFENRDIALKSSAEFRNVEKKLLDLLYAPV